MNTTITRKIEFDSAHRVMEHGGKCVNLHGHRYVLELTLMHHENKLNQLGMVFDYSKMKLIFGGWIDKHWDHGVILNKADVELIDLCKKNKWKIYQLPCNPTAENMIRHLYDIFCGELKNLHIRITNMRLYETPNCWADLLGGML